MNAGSRLKLLQWNAVCYGFIYLPAFSWSVTEFFSGQSNRSVERPSIRTDYRPPIPISETAEKSVLCRPLSMFYQLITSAFSLEFNHDDYDFLCYPFDLRASWIYVVNEQLS